ncbi:MAG: hypothetical protein DI498_00340 [Paracoccus denitrificans]|nr:MAG: hypothetical protein DI498_00340 [Paracoccus denitrificans]PZO86218.1 MAG: hypothetical protein DI633_00340 [Paracoccus denitrificans]
MPVSFIRASLLASAVAAIAASAALAQDGWVSAVDKIDGSVRAGSRDVPVKPGDDTSVQIRNVEPGSTYTVLHGATALNDAPVTADEKGAADVKFTVPADAEIGTIPLTIVGQNPSAAQIVKLKLSQVVPASGEDAFTLTTAPAGERAYQSAVSADGKLYVTSARGTGVETTLKVYDAATLEPEGEFEIPQSADAEDGLVDVLGVGVDDKNGKLWTTNTLNDTVTVYDIATKKAEKVFDEGSIQHPYDAVIDVENNRAYVSAGLTGHVKVYDATTYEPLDGLFFEGDGGRQVFGLMNLDLDVANGKIYATSRDSSYVGWADLKTGETTAVEVEGLIGASSIAHDPETGRLYVASQDLNSLLVLDAEGKEIANTQVGAGAISVAWNPVTKQAFVATRAGGTVAVLDGDGKLVANLPVGELPNHVVVDKDGAVFAVTMNGPAGDDDKSGAVTRIVAKQ